MGHVGAWLGLTWKCMPTPENAFWAPKDENSFLKVGGGQLNNDPFSFRSRSFFESIPEVT